MNRAPIKPLLTLAWRNLWRNHRRTIIMLAAITVGVWAMIFMTALMRGMVDDMLIQVIRQLPGEVRIQHTGYNDDPSINNSIPAPDRQLLAAIEGLGDTEWSSRVRVPAVISSERDTSGVILLGVEPGSESRFSFDTDNIVEGNFIDDETDEGLVIGRKLAESLETRLGKRVVIMSQDPDNEIADRGFRITGIYRADIENLEERFVYAGRRTVQDMLRLGDNVSEIAISRNDYRHVAQWFPRIEAAIEPPAKAMPWYDADSYLGSMLAVMDGFVLVWVVVIFLALSFGLVNTLIMAIFERTREIGLMMALGIRPPNIMILILFESVMLIIIGIALGNGLALLTIIPVQDGIDISIVSEGMAMMGTGSVLYPVLLVDDMITANIVVVLLGLLTSLLPAWRASRYDPVIALNKT
jgi:ABC-type lipoprotein release transport system permease subunit